MSVEQFKTNEENERKFSLYAKILKRQLEERLQLHAKPLNESLKDYLIFTVKMILPIENIENEYEDLVTELKTLEIDDNNALDLIVDTTIKFLSTRYSVDEFEKRVGDKFLESQSLEPLNRALAYKMIEGTKVDLHIPTVITDNPLELRTLVFQGLKKLAQEMQRDSKFNAVEKIVGASWIAKQNPKLAEALGFEIKRVGHMASMVEMSRDKFLERYGV